MKTKYKGLWISFGLLAAIALLLLCGCSKLSGPLEPRTAFAEEITYSTGDEQSIMIDSGAETETAKQAAEKVQAAAVTSSYDISKCSQGIAFINGAIWTANLAWSTLTKVDPATGSVLGTVPNLPNVHDLCFDGTYIWTVNRSHSRDGSVSKVDPVSMSVVATIPVGGTPQGICFDGSHVWTGDDIAGNSQVIKINTTTNAIDATVTLSGVAPHDFVFDGSHVWVCDYFSYSVSKINPITNTEVAVVRTGANPDRAYFDGSSLWVSNRGSGDVVKIDVFSNIILHRISFEEKSRPHKMASSGSYLYISKEGRGEVAKINKSTYVVEETIQMPQPMMSNPLPRGIAFDGTAMWIGCGAANYVLKVEE